MQWSKVTQNEAVFKGRSSYTQIDKPSKNFFGLAINFTPTWFQVFPGVDLLAPVTWSQGISGNAAVLFGGSEGGGNLERRHRRRHLSEVPDRSQVHRLLRRLFDQPDRRHARGRRAGRAQRRQRFALRSRLGLAHVQDHFLSEEDDHVSQRHCWPRLRGALQRRRARRGVGRRGQAARHDADAGRRRKGRQQGRHDSRVHRRASRRPADFKAGSGFRPDPFASEKPRLVITGKDAAAHADKLTEGTKELLKRYPTMRVDVYPTHRTVAVPQRVLDNTAKNATGAKTVDGGVALENVLAGYPFPIPKTGSEAMWNHLLRYNGLGYDNPRYENWNVDAAGVPTLAVTAATANWAWPIFDPKKIGADQRERSVLARQAATTSGPARRNGEALLSIDAVNPLKQPRRAWQYLPGQRRVKLAPDLAYDTPNPGAAGAGDLRRRVGVQRRDRPLRLEARRQEGDVRSVQQLSADVRTRTSAGRHEAESPQSRTSCAGSCTACGWSRRRSRPDKRHIYSKRVFYLDEDSWTALAVRPVRRARPALSLELRLPVVQLRRAGAVRRHVRDLRLQLGRLQHHRPVRSVQTACKYMTELPKDSFWSSEALAGAGLR